MPAETSTRHGIRPGYVVQLSAHDMNVQSVTNEDISRAMAEAPGAA